MKYFRRLRIQGGFMHVNYILHFKWVRRAFQFKYFSITGSANNGIGNNIYIHTHFVYTYIHACDEYFGRKEQLVFE